MASIRPSPTSPDAPRDRLVVGAGLVALGALAWAYVTYMGWGMEHMDAGVQMLIMPSMAAWNGVDLVLVFAMWAIMMAAMMVPSASPMTLLFARITRARREQGGAYVPTGLFVAGYLAMWTGFSALATLAQWGLLEARLVSPMMESASPALSGALLIAAGAFQFTPLKHACLAKCRSPLGFVLTEWREGARGAFRMGVKHGAYCVGCCGALMALLFAVGVMNLLWIVALAVLVLIEKTAPFGAGIGKLAGFALILWGASVWLAGI